MVDKYGMRITGLESPGVRSAAITPDDDNDIEITRAIFVGTGGDIAMQLAGDSAAVVFANVADGTLLPFRVKRVMEAGAGTTATDLIAIY